MQRSQRVADRNPNPHRHTPRFGTQMPQPAHGLAQHTESGLGAVGAGLTESRDPQHDQLRVQGMQHLPAQAPIFHRSGLEILDQHIGMLRQFQHRFLSMLLAQIERNRALVSRLNLPPDRGAFTQQSPGAQGISTLDRLDLDDVGTEIRQRLACKGTRNQLPEFEDLQALQCIHGVLLIRPAWRRLAMLPQGSMLRTP